MSNRHWTWTLGATAMLAGVVAAVLVTGASPARSDDEDEAHTPSREADLVTTMLDNWDDDTAREGALAAYLGAASGDELLAPVEDPTWLDAR